MAFFTELVVKSRFETRICTHDRSETTEALVKTVGVRRQGACKNGGSKVKQGPVCEAAIT